MKYFLCILFSAGNIVYAQHSLVIHLISEGTREPVVGAVVTAKGTHKSMLSDTTGCLVASSLINGNNLFIISCLGYGQKEITISWAELKKDTLLITLEQEVLNSVVVSSSRTNGRIKDLPMRVEVLGTEDMEEETDMHPGNVAMLLGEASGIQTQQTSASSGNVQIRILGLDGKYTQLLKDGFPMYSGFSNGLSIMQIPPLDLRQVEVIKGSSSALYGGDAVAGIINFISKKPSYNPAWNALVNQTSRAGTNVGSFYSARNKHWGITLLNTYTRQVAADIHNNGFTVLPRLNAFTVNPKLFWYPSNSTTLSLSVNSTYDNRVGGDLYAVNNGANASHPYIEKNKSNRNYYQLEYEKRLPHGDVLTLRNSTSLFNRTAVIADYTFSGRQVSSFTEVSYLQNHGHHKTVYGANLLNDQFNEHRPTAALLRDYDLFTAGIFLQDDWSMSKNWVVETGLRNDYTNRYGIFLLPRISVLYKTGNGLSFRVGGGLGYKNPTIFDARTEETAYKNVLPVGAGVKAETAAGITADINYETTLGEDTKLALNQSFFYTQVNNPLVLDSSSAYYYFVNASMPYNTRGLESSIRLKQDDWSLFAGYTYVDARSGIVALPHIPLTPRGKLVLDIAKEKENNYRIALEAFYTGQQYLYDGSLTKGYWVTGLLLEKFIKKVGIVLNMENVTDTRQTRFGPVVMPPFINPVFKEIYAPLEGFMANIAVKVKIL